MRASPPGSTISNDCTCRAKLPATWWFLPCTSAAMAPPTVTCLVPGDTGTNQPAGSPATMSCSRLTPASQVTRPVAGSRSMIRFSLAVEITTPPSHCAALL